ncbi:MAG TPA: DUF362 domain-containing protein [Calditrichaeota bacterium]|nr:DUF362 domain-containing protein [Calditrichota bacterium]
MKRRKFLKAAAISGAAVTLMPQVISKYPSLYAQNTPPQVVWVENGEPLDLLDAALKELQGLRQFIDKGDVVVIKPNIGWDRRPELAANTNPQLIGQLVKRCYEAGAKTVKVFDRTCNNPRRCYRNSKIEEAAKEAGAEVTQIRKNKFKKIPINGKIIKEWPIYQEYLEADKIINVPIAKHHSLAKVTLGLKNLMGVMGGNRGSLHNNFALKIADIDRKILPTLTIIDAYRILTANGPQGGNPDHVKLTRTLIASPCTVSADYLGLELFGHKLADVEHIKVAAEEGLAKFDLNNLNIKRVKLG